MKKKLVSLLLCSALVATTVLAGCKKEETPASTDSGNDTAVTEAAAEIPQDFKYYYSFDAADDKETIRKVTCEAGATMVPVEKEKNYIPGVKGEALYNDGVYGYDLEDVNGVGNSYTIAYWTYCQRSALFMPNTIWGPDIKGNKDIGAEQWAAFDWLASDDDASLQVFPGIWSNEGAGVGRAEWKAAGSDPQTGHWMHLALVVDENSVSADGNLNIAKVYVDGQEYSKIANGEVVPVNVVKSAMQPADSFEFLLGINYWDAVFKGAYDELYIYDRALDASEIAAIASVGDRNVKLEEPERVIEPKASESYITALGDLTLKATEGQYTSDVYPIKDGETFKFTLKNWSDGADLKNNYILKFATEAGNELATVYADATGTLVDGNTDLTNYFTYTWGNWNTWLSNVMREASPVITVSRDNDIITLSCDNIDVYGTPGVNVASVSFATFVDPAEAVNLTFTNKDSYVEIVSVKDLTAKAGGINVGATDRTSAFWTEFSDIFAVPAGKSVTKTFTNYTNGAENWNNFVCILQSTPTGHADTTEGYKEYGVVRADNYGWGAGYEGIATTECDWNWDTFKEDMEGAKINLTITNNTDSADVVFTAETVAGVVYHQAYKGIAVDGDLYACFTVDGSYINFDTVTVGNTDRTSPFWSAFSDIYAVPEGESKTIFFKNYTSGAENWNNFNVVLQATPTGHADTTEGYKEYAVVRADNYGWGAGYEGICTPDCDWNWDSFKADMDGAYVALTVTNNGSTADVNALVTTADGSKVYHQNYPGIAIDGDLYFCLVMDGAYVTIESEKVGNTDLSSPFWTAFSTIYPVAEGETVYKSFTNYTTGAENWNNFNVVLQNTPTGHADTTEGYKEYAVVRSDNYGWGAGYEGIVTPECTWNWDSFKEDMNGAHVLLAVTNNGSTADVKAYVTTEAGVSYTQNYTGIAIDGDLYFCFVMDGSYILIDGQ